MNECKCIFVLLPFHATFIPEKNVYVLLTYAYFLLDAVIDWQENQIHENTFFPFSLSDIDKSHKKM